MDKKEVIRLIHFFNNIDIEEKDVTEPGEKENGQLVVIVTYSYNGKNYTTRRLFYKEISGQDNIKDLAKIQRNFGSQVFWIDISKHPWQSDNPQIKNIIEDIFGVYILDFEKLNHKIREFTEDGKSRQYGRNLESNNHWHDIINLIKAYIRGKGNNISDTYFSRMVYNWHNEERCQLNSGYSFLQYLQKNIKMVQSELQCERIKSLLTTNYQVILQGPPGTGKTRLAKELAYSLINGEPLPALNTDRTEKLKRLEKSEQFRLIQFHPSYSYEDFVRGIVADTIGEKITYKVQNKVLAQMAAQACSKSDQPYVLIIDEINRANLSSVLGELIYALEYRGEVVESMYDLADENGRKIILPKNLFIIGTMNTADRSVGSIDYALRRRFVFETILPDKNVIPEIARDLFKSVTQLFVKDVDNFGNDCGEASPFLSGDFQFADVMLGHSYFLGDKEKIKSKLEYQVKPLLKEYVKDGVLKESASQVINGLGI